MTTFQKRMIGYASYHRDPRNKFTHLFGVPMVFYSPLIALGWLRMPVGGFELSAALVVLVAVMFWYLILEWKLGTLMSLISVPAFYLCDMVSKLPFAQSLAIFLGITVVGWTIQLIGHVFEGKRPALVDNLSQSLMGPLFVLTEVLNFFGFRKDLERLAHAEMQA